MLISPAANVICSHNHVSKKQVEIRGIAKATYDFRPYGSIVDGLQNGKMVFFNIGCVYMNVNNITKLIEFVINPAMATPWI